MEFNPSLFSENYKMAFIDPNKIGSPNTSILNQTINRDPKESIAGNGEPDIHAPTVSQDRQDYTPTLRLHPEDPTNDLFSVSGVTRLTNRAVTGAHSMIEGFSTEGIFSNTGILLMMILLLFLFTR